MAKDINFIVIVITFVKICHRNPLLSAQSVLSAFLFIPLIRVLCYLLLDSKSAFNPVDIVQFFPCKQFDIDLDLAIVR